MYIYIYIYICYIYIYIYVITVWIYHFKYVISCYIILGSQPAVQSLAAMEISSPKKMYSRWGS